MNAGDRLQLLAHRDVARVGLRDRRPAGRPSAPGRACRGSRPWTGEVVVDEPVGDAGLVGDVRHAAGVEALAREHAHGGVEDQPPLVGGLSAAGRRPSGRHLGRPAVRSGRALASEGSRRRISRLARRGRGRRRRRPRGRARSRARAPTGSTIIERPPERMPARVLAELVGGDDERLLLDRAGAQQDLPVVARGGEREGGGHGRISRRCSGEDAVELGEADVVADAQARGRRRRRSPTATISSPGCSWPTRCTRGRRRRRRTCGSCGRSP